jgi:hypothetical protein
MEMRYQQEQENTNAAQRAGMTQELKAMFEANQPVFGVLTMKQMTLGIKKFDGSEP